MNEQIVGITIEFLKRVQLQGHEVPAYNAVVGALSALLVEKPDKPIETEQAENSGESEKIGEAEISIEPLA